MVLATSTCFISRFQSPPVKLSGISRLVRLTIGRLGNIYLLLALVGIAVLYEAPCPCACASQSNELIPDHRYTTNEAKVVKNYGKYSPLQSSSNIPICQISFDLLLLDVLPPTNLETSCVCSNRFVDCWHYPYCCYCLWAWALSTARYLQLEFNDLGQCGCDGTIS